MMKKYGYKILVKVVLLAFILPGFSYAGDVAWVSYDQALVKAKSEKKPILLNFYADWCGYCKKMDRDVFKNDPVVKYLNEHFIPVRVNGEKEKNIASTYSVRAYPTTWFLKSDGSKISNLPGYVPADTMSKILRFLRTGSYEKMSFKEFSGKG